MLTRGLTLLAAAAAATLALPATAQGAATLQIGFAEFSGYYAGPRRVSTSGMCNEVLTDGPGAGTFTCTVDFTITKGVDVCDIDAGDAAGVANYYSHNPEFDIKKTLTVKIKAGQVETQIVTLQ